MFSLSTLRNVFLGPRKPHHSARPASRRRTRKLTVELLENRMCLSGTFVSSDGSLDTSFGGTGIVTTTFPLGSNSVAQSVAVESDGKIVVAGYTWNTSETCFNFGLARYNADGSLDASFGSSGKVTNNFGFQYALAFSVALQADGKIVVAGEVGNGYTYDFAVARYDTDGTLDTTFGGTGEVTTDFGSWTAGAGGVAVEADGEIVVAGTSSTGPWVSSVAVACYNSNGSPDTTFGGSGKVTANFSTGQGTANGVVVQADGKIVIAGDSNGGGGGRAQNFGLMRFNLDGTLDSSFGGTGAVITSFNNYERATGLALQADGKIVAVGEAGDPGQSYFDFAVARYNTDGSLDTNFNGSGKASTSFVGFAWSIPTCVAVQPDGEIVVGGVAQNAQNGSDGHFAVARYDANGSLDAGFNGTGMVITSFAPNAGFINGVAVQPDGKIVAVGNTSDGIRANFAVARYGTQAIPVGIDIEPGSAAYSGSPYLDSNIASTLTPRTAEGVITYSFFSDAGGTNVIPAPTNAGTYYVKGHFDGDPGYSDADSAIVGFTINKAALTGIATTQDALNYLGKQGAFTIALSSISGLQGSDTVASVFASAVFSLEIGSNTYEFAPNVSVDSVTNTVYVTYTLRGGTAAGDALRYDLALLDATDPTGVSTSASKVSVDAFWLYADSTDYMFADDCLTRLFAASK